MAVVCIGEVVVDWLCTETTLDFDSSRTFLRSLGGNTSNVAIGLRRLGTPTYLVGKVGVDLHAHYLKRTLSREGVDLTYLVEDASCPTAQCYVLTGADGEQAYFNWPQPHAADSLVTGEVDLAVLTRVCCLHSTGISLTLEPRRSAVLSTMRAAAAAGHVVSFDAGFPTGRGAEGRSAAEEAMSLAGLIKCNRYELAFWLDRPADDPLPEMALALFRRYEPAVLAVTLGSRGSLLVTEAGMIESGPLVVDTVNTVGAGDAFVAGFIHGLHERLGERFGQTDLSRLTGGDWATVAALANAAGAAATTTLSAWEGLASREKLFALMGKAPI